MRYHNITRDDMLNGDGLRVVLWVAGCNHCCKECQNPVTWDPNGGLPFDQAAKQELFDQLEKSYISGVTFSGGDPLYPGNRMEITALAKEIREKFPLVHGANLRYLCSLMEQELSRGKGMILVSPEYANYASVMEMLRTGSKYPLLHARADGNEEAEEVERREIFLGLLE